MAGIVRLFCVAAGCLLLNAAGIICHAQATDKGSRTSQVNDKCPSFGKDPDKYPALKEMIVHIQQFVAQANGTRSTLPAIDLNKITVRCDIADALDMIDKESDRKELENAIAFYFTINGHKGNFIINIQSPMFVSADRAFKDGNPSIDMVIAEGRIYSEYVDWRNSKVSSTNPKAVEIAYVSRAFDKLSAALRSDQDQEARAKDYLAKLKAKEPKN